MPLLRSLRKNFPDALIDVLAEKRNGQAISLCPAANRVFLYDNLRDLKFVMTTRHSVIIDTEQWHRLSAVIALLTGAPFLVGYATNERRRLLTHTVSYSHEEYEANSFFNLLTPLGIERPSTIEYPFLEVPVEAAERMRRILSEFSGHPFVAIFPGASIPERRWGADKFRRVAERLRAIGLRVVVVGGPGDVAEGEQIISGVSGLNLAGKTSLAETAAVINESSVLVSGDSGILHIGVGLGKPTVSLFGPGIAKKWAPRGENHIVINKNLPCSPCTRFGYTPRCQVDARCMADITVEEVADAVIRLIARNGTRNEQQLPRNNLLDNSTSTC
jgi:ADP-heptose:LPS heptosyltransferase